MKIRGTEDPVFPQRYGLRMKPSTLVIIDYLAIMLAGRVDQLSVASYVSTESRADSEWSFAESTAARTSRGFVVFRRISPDSTIEHTFAACVSIRFYSFCSFP